VGVVNGYVCACAPGFSGTLCETNINECLSLPCQTGGTCLDQVNGFMCVCPAGYSGQQCQTSIDECASAPCQNGGSCNDGVNNFVCLCAVGNNGFLCQDTLSGGSSGSSSATIPIAAGAGGGVLILIVIAILLCQRRRKLRQTPPPPRFAPPATGSSSPTAADGGSFSPTLLPEMTSTETGGTLEMLPHKSPHAPTSVLTPTGAKTTDPLILPAGPELAMALQSQPEVTPIVKSPDIPTHFTVVDVAPTTAPSPTSSTASLMSSVALQGNSTRLADIHVDEA